MTPTMKLRFVFRTVPVGEECMTHKLILQQWWEDWVKDEAASALHYRFMQKKIGEWRDVPLENEDE